MVFRDGRDGCLGDAAWSRRLMPRLATPAWQPCDHRGGRGLAVGEGLVVTKLDKPTAAVASVE